MTKSNKGALAAEKVLFQLKAKIKAQERNGLKSRVQQTMVHRVAKLLRSYTV